MYIYFSPIPYSGLDQRPQAFFRWAQDQLSSAGQSIAWVNPYPTRLPYPSDLARIWKCPTCKHDFAEPGPLRLNPRALPLEPFGWFHATLRAQLRPTLKQLIQLKPRGIVIGKPSLLTLDLLDLLSPSTPVIFDVMDHMPAFLSGRSARWMHFLMEHHLSRAQTVWFSSQRLRDMYAPMLTWNTKVHIVRNGIDSNLFSAQGWAPEPKREKVVLGYVGTIANWFDWEAIQQLALRYPEVEIRIFGPIEGRLNRCAKTAAKNIKIMGTFEKSRLPSILYEFDVGLIPFKVNPLTDGVDPLKYYEYRAAGLGVIATPFGEMSFRGAKDGMWHFDDPLALQSALLETNRLREKPRLLSELVSMDWSQRFRESGFEEWMRANA